MARGAALAQEAVRGGGSTGVGDNYSMIMR